MISLLLDLLPMDLLCSGDHNHFTAAGTAAARSGVPTITLLLLVLCLTKTLFEGPKATQGI